MTLVEKCRSSVPLFATGTKKLLTSVLSNYNHLNRDKESSIGEESWTVRFVSSVCRRAGLPVTTAFEQDGFRGSDIFGYWLFHGCESVEAGGGGIVGRAEEDPCPRNGHEFRCDHIF